MKWVVHVDCIDKRNSCRILNQSTKERISQKDSVKRDSNSSNDVNETELAAANCLSLAHDMAQWFCMKSAKAQCFEILVIFITIGFS